MVVQLRVSEVSSKYPGTRRGHKSVFRHLGVRHGGTVFTPVGL